MTLMRTFLIACCLLSFTAVHRGDPAPTTVFLVRHAERAEDGTPDPGLSEAGRERAMALVAAVGEENLAAIFVTQFKRTARTAGPIAQARNLEPIVVEAKNGY